MTSRIFLDEHIIDTLVKKKTAVGSNKRNLFKKNHIDYRSINTYWGTCAAFFNVL